MSSRSPANNPPRIPADTPENAVSTSLDPQETSVITNNSACNCERDLPPDLQLDDFTPTSRFRHSGWTPIRRLVWQALVKTYQPRGRLQAFAHCGCNGWLQRSRATEPTPTGPRHRFRIVTANCHDRLCTPCANARAALIRQRLRPLIEGRHLLFITLTIAGHREDLRTKIDRLYAGFRALRSHPTFKSKVHGGAAFLEIKWSDKAQRWHPHFHIIADGSYIPAHELSDAWRSITHDSFIVDIQRETRPERVESYVTKYASKPLNTSFVHNPALLEEAIVALKGRRLVTCFYSWYGTALSRAEDEELADDLIDAEGYENFLPLTEALSLACGGDPETIDQICNAGYEFQLRRLWTPPPSS